MGKQLKDIDFGDLVDVVAKPAESEAPAIAAPSPAIEQQRTIEREIIADAAESRPSPYQSDLRAKLRKKKAFQLGEVPQFVYEFFEQFASENGMTKREYLYHLLRKEGADIPPYSQMDRRKL